MIHYPHVIMACAGEIWAIQEEKLREITAFLMLKAEGGSVSPEDLARITQKQEREVAQSGGDVAILPVYGTLAQRMSLMGDISGGTSTMQLAAGFRAALADPGVKAIVFDHNSPGGTASGTGELAAEILDSRGAKPIIAQVNSLSASASYWLAAAADEVVVTPGGEAGALGVYRIHEDVSKMLEQKGVKPTVISADGAPYKTEGMDIAPLSDEARAFNQARVNQVFDRFVRSVADGRNTTLTNVRENFGKGRVFGAEELVSRGMADRIDTLEATLERFGTGSFNPVAKAARLQKAARAEAGSVLLAKWKAGDLPSTRELEDGLRGILGLSKSEAEQAVRLSFKGDAPGDPARKTESAVTGADVEDIRRGIADIRQLLTV
jgi:signal peptide peptidase SppA